MRWPKCKMHLLLLACAPVLVAQRGALKDSATVTIQLIDEVGRTVACRVTGFVDKSRDREMASHFDGLRGMQVPYGTYEYNLTRIDPGAFGEMVSGRVSVHLQEELLVIATRRNIIKGVAVDTRIPSGFVIRGKLEPMPVVSTSLEQIRIRLSAVHQNDYLDLFVDASGEFRIYKPLVGRYLLAVIQEDAVLDIKQISFEDTPSPSSFVVKLSGKPPDVVYVH